MSRLSVQQRRQLLLDAARRIAVTQGFAEISTRAVTDEAGMPRGSFHYCFRSKDELLGQLHEQYLDQMTADLELSWDDSKTLAMNMCAQFRAALRMVESDPGAQLLYHELTVHMLRGRPTGPQAARTFDYSQRTMQYLRWIESRAGVTWQRPVQLLARMYNATLNGAILQWLADRDTELTEATVGVFIGMLVELAEPHRSTA